MHLLFLIASLCYFAPPQGWQPALPKESPSPIEIGFVGQGGLRFSPSLNIAFEETDVSLKEYVKAVQEIHLADPNTRWRDLGPFNTQSGIGRLTEIDSKTPLGDAKILQLLFVDQKKAYILTGAVLKEEFSKYQKELLKTFHSFRFIPNFLSLVEGGQQEEIGRLLASLSQGSSEDRQGKWGEFEKSVEKEATKLGTYWHFLALREGKKALAKAE